MGAKSQHELFDDDAHRDTFKINTNLAVSAADRSRRREKRVVGAKESTLNMNGGLSFSEFMEFLCMIAIEGMSSEEYHKMFDSPFKEDSGSINSVDLADIKKLEEVLQLHVDIVI